MDLSCIEDQYWWLYNFYLNQIYSGGTQLSKMNIEFIGHKHGTFQKFKDENGIRAIKCIRSESFKASWLLIGSL